MEWQLDDLDERFTALEGVQNRGEVYLDSVEQISAPRVAAEDVGPRWRAAEESAVTMAAKPLTRGTAGATVGARCR
jgi:hypothetical protein